MFWSTTSGTMPIIFNCVRWACLVSLAPKREKNEVSFSMTRGNLKSRTSIWTPLIHLGMAIRNGNSCKSVFPNSRGKGTARMK